MMQLMSTQGPIARSVEDVRLALSAMTGRDVRDPWWTPSTINGYGTAVPIRVALATELPGTSITDDVRQSLLLAGQIFEQSGYLVENISPPEVSRCMEVWAGLICTEIRSILRDTMNDLGSNQIQNALDYLQNLSKECDLSEYIRLGMERTRLMREWATFQENYPIIVGPVSNIPPFQPNEDIKSQSHAEHIFKAQGLMVSANLLGLPAAVVSTGVVNQQPLGVQIISPRYHDSICLDAAQVLETYAGKLTPIDPITSH
tara:strand:- start:579 stop:1355 length:777 start_codon:yes stop_codon:yes gene_type:complete